MHKVIMTTKISLCIVILLSVCVFQVASSGCDTPINKREVCTEAKGKTGDECLLVPTCCWDGTDANVQRRCYKKDCSKLIVGPCSKTCGIGTRHIISVCGSTYFEQIEKCCIRP